MASPGRIDDWALARYGIGWERLRATWTREQLLIRWTYAHDDEAERVKDMEAAVTHGYLSARVKGYAEKRHGRPAGKPITDLVSDMGRLGFVHSGPSPDGPVH